MARRPAVRPIHTHELTDVTLRRTSTQASPAWVEGSLILRRDRVATCSRIG